MTEMISSTDLIEEQILVAMGEKLSYKQVIRAKVFLEMLSIKKRGVSISNQAWVLCRKTLCSEDIQLNAVSMQKTPSKDSDLVQVRFKIIRVCLWL